MGSFGRAGFMSGVQEHDLGNFKEENDQFICLPFPNSSNFTQVLETLTKLCDHPSYEVVAVVLEPFMTLRRFKRPNTRFLKGLSTLRKKHGFALVSDESITG